MHTHSGSAVPNGALPGLDNDYDTFPFFFVDTHDVRSSWACVCGYV